jgi:hypothetical protein
MLLRVLSACHPCSNRRSFHDHRSSPATTKLDDDGFLRADYLCQLGNGWVLLVRRYTFLPRLDPYDALYNVDCLLESIYIVVCEATRCRGYCSTSIAVPNTHSIVVQVIKEAIAAIAATHTGLNGDTCFVRCPSMLHRSDGNSHPSSFLHTTISVWESQPYIS